jgi:lipopolysaccharide export system permease protein
LEVSKLSYSLLLSFFPIAIPVAFLFSVLMGISRVNSEGEILALQANGISVKQVYFPLLLFSFLVTGLCLYTSLYSVPKGNRDFELRIEKLTHERVMAALKPGVFIEGFYGLTLFAEQLVPVKNELRRVYIYDVRDEKNPLVITSQSGILRNFPGNRHLTLRLNNGSIYIEKKTSEGVQQKLDFELYDINLNVGEGGERWRDYSPPSFTYPQLLARLEETKNDPPQNLQLQVEMHRRFSLSFSCVVFSALGFFIGILSQRGIRSTAIIFCMLVGVVYWLSYVAANALALSGWLSPGLGIWLPNFFFIGVAVLCYRKYRRGA